MRLFPELWCIGMDTSLHSYLIAECVVSHIYDSLASESSVVSLGGSRGGSKLLGECVALFAVEWIPEFLS